MKLELKLLLFTAIVTVIMVAICWRAYAAVKQEQLEWNEQSYKNGYYYGINRQPVDSCLFLNKQVKDSWLRGWTEGTNTK